MRDMLLDLSRRGDFSQDAGGGRGANMVEAVAQEFGRRLKQYEADLATLLDDFANRYISSGAFVSLCERLNSSRWTY
jgi:hypothetical protein